MHCVDPRWCGFPGIERELGHLKENMGTTTAAEFRTDTVKYHRRTDGLNMKYIEEKQQLMLQVMACIEEYRTRRGLNPFPQRLHHNRPSPSVNMRPLVRVPPPPPKYTTHNAIDLEALSRDAGREALSGERRLSQRPHSSLQHDLIHMLDDTCVTGAFGVILGRQEDGQAFFEES